MLHRKVGLAGLLLGVLAMLLSSCASARGSDALRVESSPDAQPSSAVTTPPADPVVIESATPEPSATKSKPRPRPSITDPGCPSYHPHCVNIINYPTGEDCGTPGGAGNIGAEATASSAEGLTLTLQITPCHVGMKTAHEEKGDNQLFLWTHLQRPASVDVRIDIAWGDGSTENAAKNPIPCGGKDFGEMYNGPVRHQWTSAGRKTIHVHYVILTCEPKQSASPDPSPDPSADPSTSPSPTPSPSPFTQRTETIDVSMPIFVHETTPWFVHH